MQIHATNWSTILPDELLLKVFHYCSRDYKTLLRIGGVCKKWRQVASEDVLWTEHREICLRMRIKRKLWSGVTVSLGQKPHYVNIRELIIDRTKKLYVLFEDGGLYHLSRQGKLSFCHRFGHDVPSDRAVAFLGGKFDYSTDHKFSIVRYREGGEWVRGFKGEPGYHQSISYAHHLRILMENGETESEMPMFHDTVTQIVGVGRIEKFGKYILTCGFRGNRIGNEWNDNLAPNVMWEIKENTDGNYTHHLTDIIQLSLSNHALLIDGLYIDIIDHKIIKLMNFVANPLTNTLSTSTCTIV